MLRVVYYSSRSNNTHRFVTALEVEALRIPIELDASPLQMTEPYVLIAPTYSDGYGNGAVAKPIIRFLNVENNREHLKGVIASGNRNFGTTFAMAGDVIAKKCKVPVLYRFELAGDLIDVQRVKEGMEKLWKQHQKIIQ